MDFIMAIEYIGIAAFALSGFYVAVKYKLDLLGIFISSFLTALGGGITRDTLANRIPNTFIQLEPGLIVVCVLALAILFNFHKRSQVEKNFLFVLSDTLGLVSFSISSAMIGIESGLNYFGVVLLGFITAVGGGVFRDILLNEVPLLLSTGLYGTVSLVVGSLLYIFYILNILNPFTIILIFIFGLIFRLLAYYRNWHLPTLKWDFSTKIWA